jgi:4-amino-4-deoxy-L-arabinose transferase-like glycosyltransferase
MSESSAATAKWPHRERLQALLPFVLLLVAATALYTYLLWRLPFDGLYGQDSYAYYYQARELWDGLWGRPLPAWPFVSEGLYHWPVGYHMHLMAGFILAGENPVGGRFITLAMAATEPLLVAALTRAVWVRSTTVQAALAGVVAGCILLLVGVYTRAGLTLMADVPAIFWSTLGIYCLLRGWSPENNSGAETRSRAIWVAGCGVALGISILLRYISALALAPVVAYLALWYWERRGRGSGFRLSQLRMPAIAVGALACALLPQLVYTLAQPLRPLDTSGSVVWSLGNLLRTTLAGPDGSQTFQHSMARFYFIDPFFEVSMGFLTRFYLPALLLGLFTLSRQRNLKVGVLLLGWWLVPAVFFSGGLYQAHRFIIMYLPPLVIVIGIGAASAITTLAVSLRNLKRFSGLAVALLTTAITLSLVAGLVQSWRGTYRQVTELVSTKDQEQAIIALAQAAVKPTGAAVTTQPKAVVFGLSAALYHYTQWPILDIFNHDQAEIARFLTGDGPRLAVIPEESMASQWAGTPSGARWEWLRANYTLINQGSIGDYTVYLLSGP